MIGFLADLIFKIFDRILASMRSSQARRNAILGKYSRVLSDGKVINLSKNKNDVKIGFNARVRGEIFCFPHAGRISIGDWFYVGPNSLIWSSNDVGISIGNRVLISSNVTVFDTNSHPLDKYKRFEQTKAIFDKGHPNAIDSIKSSPIVIEDDVWICNGATIMKGVHIKKGAIIGANAIILSDVSEGCLIQPGTTHKEV
jgi:maltose O-acetyltransferase